MLLLNLLSPPDKCDVDRMSSTDLAYIGDVVYEMLVRSKKVWPPKRTSDLQNQVVRLVRGKSGFGGLSFGGLLSLFTCSGCFDLFVLFFLILTAEYQSALVARLRDPSATKEGPLFQLTLDEEQCMNRGRNAGAKTNHRKSNPAAYQDATALEALLGYLYITDKARCTELLQWIEYNLDRIKS